METIGTKNVNGSPVFIAGRVAFDPETQYTLDGDEVVTFSVTTQVRVRSNLVNLEDLVKGAKVAVLGRLSARKGTLKDGEPALFLSVTGKEVTLLSLDGSPAPWSEGEAAEAGESEALNF